MLNIITVCGNGIGSSLMLKMTVEEICNEEGVAAEVESCDFAAAQGKPADLIITVKEFANQFHEREVVTVRSYMNKRKVKEDVLEKIKEMSE
ncbi:PTS sugar transporter subunit IIB [Numidum massiliense]|uniref:PTS sugar transporter subunit IIB n=1 Tax=Numidum massiliense TaxID=1522315 RepID=UPI0006D559CE|nr:PTS sugar transporter subunit IIB [Numidum massiliense]